MIIFVAPAPAPYPASTTPVLRFRDPAPALRTPPVVHHTHGAANAALRRAFRAGHHAPEFMNFPSENGDHDAALVAAMARGDQNAAAKLYDRHASIVYGLALRMLGDSTDAEEVALEAFSQAWREATRYDASRATVAGWLTTITRSRALDAIRSRKRRERVKNEAEASGEATAMGQGFAAADERVEQADLTSAVARAMRELPDKQRHSIELAFFEGLTHPEIADRLREPLGTVKTRIRLGMLKLRDLLSGQAKEHAI